MGVSEDNPLCSINGAPVPVAHKNALGRTRSAVPNLDFPLVLVPAPSAAPVIATSALQPIMDAMVAFGNASRDRNAAKEDLC
jgi:hypothetical protein